ncbi:aminoglycoside phosphotransferase family protein [Streptomyces rubellomurinus]|uniref:aminoglycoside phosphotransferase family protein n=1 Tax=Streptomyces rubellomurinus (strain ATCC 31215) TaxID=359131 RepID=UPI000A9EF6A0|nr:aminoglycoside phosphotransferase family protein [Streptomyces rubellomurinus]
MTSSEGKMHADEVDIDAALVRRMVAARFPQWAGLPVESVVSSGTSNAMFRLGAELVVRLPRIAAAAEDVAKEQRWLPRLAPELPVAVPAPLGVGGPVAGYPLPWSVLGWLDGANPVPGRPDEPELLARDLAAFTTALQRVDPTGGPASYRSETLAARDGGTRAAIAALAGVVPAGEVTSAWEAALRAPAHGGAPVWIHADLQPGNLLVSADGRLSAVIDFGCLGLGDPAVDLLAAWYVLPATARDAFRAAVGADEAAWARGRGWALSVALMELSYYRETNPRMARTARYVIGEVLAERTAAARASAGHVPAGQAPADGSSAAGSRHP